jgi:UDP-N-acetylglucosamine--N-acetylmuramyl-(pentapeptide) pyrophosphoryl-undecaprenol N-acetylglucosamine transferase
MRVLIAGGGTGGHIYPGITLASTIKEADPSHEILFVGTNRGLEADVVPRTGYKLHILNLSGIPRRLSLGIIKSVFRAGKGMMDTVRLLRSFKPDVVVGTGGYVCGPVVLTAAVLGYPTLIQEQNAFPGITNRILGRFVRKVCLGYQAAEKFFPRNKVIVTGNPIRPEIGIVPRTLAAQRLGIRDDRQTMLVFGASQGAQSINRALLESLPVLLKHEDLQVLWITGNANYETIKEQWSQTVVTQGKEAVHIWPYLHNMPDAFAVADWVVSRAGAISLAEITRQGLPAILIPYPFATGDHQTYNARVLAEAGAAWVVADSQLKGEDLVDMVERLISSPSLKTSMGEASLGLSHPKAAQDLAREVLALGQAK